MMKISAKEKFKIVITFATTKDASYFLDLEALCFGMKRNPDVTYFWTPAVSYLWSFQYVLVLEIRQKPVEIWSFLVFFWFFWINNRFGLFVRI
jgi:hypothetical protein